jgi:sec-independent protein translocase protein TatC
MPPTPSDRARLSDPRAMSFGEHLEELRRRLIIALVGIVPIFVLALVFGDTLLHFVIAPAERELLHAGLPPKLIYTGPLELLGAWLRVAVVVTLVIGIPFIFYQLWLFISPGLYEHEKRFVRFLIPLSVALSMVGLAFLYYLMLPAMLSFLIKFGASISPPTVDQQPTPPGLVLPTVPVLDFDPSDAPSGSMWFNRKLQEFRLNVAPPVAAGEPPLPIQIRGAPMTKAAGIAPQFRVSEFVGLVFTTSIAMILGFQTPVVVLLLGWIGIVEDKVLRKKRKYALFFAFALGAILAPSPDPLSMLFMAIPLYILFEFGLFLLKFFPPSRVARGVKPADLVTAPQREGPDAGDE